MATAQREVTLPFPTQSGSQEPLPHPCWPFLAGLTLSRSCSGQHSSCEFMSAAATCDAQRSTLHSVPSSRSYILSQDGLWALGVGIICMFLPSMAEQAQSAVMSCEFHLACKSDGPVLPEVCQRLPTGSRAFYTLVLGSDPCNPLLS